eukprot:scaffold3035_cov72-Phaeocystis_antarctica.AAC.3
MGCTVCKRTVTVCTALRRAGLLRRVPTAQGVACRRVRGEPAALRQRAAGRHGLPAVRGAHAREHGEARVLPIHSQRVTGRRAAEPRLMP